MTKKVDYPEHEKLKKVQKESQVCGELLDWLQNEKGIVLCKYNDSDYAMPVYMPIQDILGEFFGIDQNKLEKEKVAMLDAIRKQNLI